MSAWVWFWIAVAIAIVVFFYMSRKSAKTTATVIIDEPVSEKPVPMPEDIAPATTPNPIVDRAEAEREVLEEIENGKPLDQAEFVESPMVEPLDAPQSSPVDPAEAMHPDEVETPKKAFTGTRFVGDLTDEEVRAIRSSDKTVAELALQYDKSDTTIRRIKNRKSYAHVS